MSPNFFDSKIYWKHELDKLNSSLPKERKSIQHLIQMEFPSFITREEQIQEIPIQELNDFVSFFREDQEIRSKIKLPLILLYQGGTYKTSGSKYDIWTVERLLGHEKSNIIISINNYKPKHDYYYTHQINKLRRSFPNLIQIGYSL